MRKAAHWKSSGASCQRSGHARDRSGQGADRAAGRRRRPASTIRWSASVARGSGWIVGLELFVVVSAAVCAPISAWLASRRDRDRGLWALFGVILGPIALAILTAAPPAACPACGSRWPGWARTCPACAAGQEPPPAGGRPEAESGSPAGGSGVVAAIDRQPPAGETTGTPRTPAGARPVGGSISRPDEAPVTTETTVLATGIFLGGTPALIIGMPYGIGIRGDNVVVTGPLTTSPGEIVVEQPRETAGIWIAAERTLLTAGRRHRGGPEVGLFFGSLAVARGVDLEQRVRGS